MGRDDQADELAKRVEDFEPNDGDERPVEEYFLQRYSSTVEAI